jgi:hypothetical protein
MMNFQVDLIDTDLRAMKTVELRKLAASGGLKGQSSARKEHLLGLLEPIQLAQVENMEKVAAQAKAASESATEVPSDEEAAKKARRSRRGMVIVAKGTEIHKSQTFAEAAKAAGWSVMITRTADVVEEDGEEFELERYVAIASRNGSSVEASWIGKAWDYPNASAGIGGKVRKVRNLKEALRILAGQA